MKEKKPLYKIYSRNRIKIFKPKKYGKIYKKRDIKKFLLSILVLLISLSCVVMYKSIVPIFETTCIDEANAIATRITNDGSSKAMQGYTYNDMFTIEKDENGNIQMINANVFVINQIQSYISAYIQNAIDGNSSSTVKLAIGSFTGIRMLSGIGPDIKIRLSSAGRINTNLKSEFAAQGINQTIHRIYLQVDCKIDVLTPFNTMEQNISNQVLLAENVIVGQVPDTYYNLEGLNSLDTLNVTQ